MQATLEHKQALVSKYEMDVNYGFLPSSDPLVQVPAALGRWADIAMDLPKLLVADQVRQTVDQMPVIPQVDVSASRPELERAMLAFSFIAHAYIWGSAVPPKSLPPSIAVPWCQVASKLGRPPVLSYPSYALYNWRRIDKNGPIGLGNIALIQNFLAGIDEEWFVVVHVDIEAKAAPAMAAILVAQEAVANQDAPALQNEFGIIDKSLAAMYETLLRIPEHCDPYIYYQRVRPYIHGWKDHPLFPNGLIYTGSEIYNGQGQFFRGETGAQSSIIPALDAALGIVHDNDRMTRYLDEMRTYMPPRHRAFIEKVEQGASIREFVKSKESANASLFQLYNSCVQWVEKFRSKHLEYARDYIHRQSQTAATNPSAVGTGGTPFMPYLEKHRDETAHHVLK